MQFKKLLIRYFALFIAATFLLQMMPVAPYFILSVEGKNLADLMQI